MILVQSEPPRVHWAVGCAADIEGASVDCDRPHVSLDQEFDGVDAKAGEVTVVVVGLDIMEALGPAGPHADHGFGWDLSVLGLPVEHVFLGERVVCVLIDLVFRNIDHHTGADELLELDLVYAAAIVVPVRRRVDVGSDVAGHLELALAEGWAALWLACIDDGLLRELSRSEGWIRLFATLHALFIVVERHFVTTRQTPDEREGLRGNRMGAIDNFDVLSTVE